MMDINKVNKVIEMAEKAQLHEELIKRANQIDLGDYPVVEEAISTCAAMERQYLDMLKDCNLHPGVSIPLLKTYQEWVVRTRVLESYLDNQY